MATKDDHQKEAGQKDAEGNASSGRISFGKVFRGLESLLDTVIKLEEEGRQEHHYEGEANSRSGHLKALFDFSIKTNLLDNLPVRITEPVGAVAQKHVIEEEREPFIDLFNEEEYVLINVELPDVAEKDIQTEVHGDILILSTTGNNQTLIREVILPERIDATTITKKHTNGILEIRMRKR